MYYHNLTFYRNFNYLDFHLQTFFINQAYNNNFH